MENKEEKANIDKVREYMAKCPYLDEYAELNVEYLLDKVKAYSINENADKRKNEKETVCRYNCTTHITIRLW